MKRNLMQKSAFKQGLAQAKRGTHGAGCEND